jgi:hypothetical protein
MGLFVALQWLRDLHLDHIDFALDSETITKAFHHHQPDISEFGQVMADARRLFSSSFTNSRVEFNRRQVNEVAHVLARVAPFSSSFTIYIDVPIVLINLLLMKCYKHISFKKKYNVD